MNKTLILTFAAIAVLGAGSALAGDGLYNQHKRDEIRKENSDRAYFFEGRSSAEQPAPEQRDLREENPGN